MARNAIDALLGRLLQDGEELELRGGLNFKTPLTLTESDDGYDVEVADAALGGVTYLREQDVGGTYASSTEFINCRITGAITLTGTATFRGCKAAGAYAITATAIETDRASAYALQSAGCTVSVLPTPLDFVDLRYGSGSTGDATITAGTTPVNTAEYANLTISGSGSLRDNGGRVPIYVKGLLDLSSAAASAITTDTAGFGNGGNASGATGGTAGTGDNGFGQQWPGRLSGTAGSNGTTGAGATPAAGTAWRNTIGGTGGASGAGGSASGGGTAGGAGGAAGGTISQGAVHIDQAFQISPGSTGLAPETCWPGLPGRGGASGAGDGTRSGGGGGGSGAGGGTVILRARGIKLGAGTATAAISAVGGKGGNGGNESSDASAGNAGGGSGAGAGGGGFVLVHYEWIIGAGFPADVIKASGGAGGNGGNGFGTGLGGDGGDGGQGGQIVLVNTITGRRTVVLGSAGSADTPHSGATGGTGGAGGACTSTFPAAPGG